MSICDHLENEGYPEGWEKFFEENISLIDQVDKVIEKKGWDITPDVEDIFKAYQLTRPEDIKVIIMGMDPYYNGNAMGLAFSVVPGSKIPPSLANIFKVIKKNTGRNSQCAKNGDLTSWGEQGVFLLNASLTATLGSSGGCGKVWDGFIKRTLEYIFKQKFESFVNEIGDDSDSDSDEEEKVKMTRQQITENTEKHSKPITLLWGRNAQVYEKFCSGFVLTSSHPSPMSFTQGFSECSHFSDVNQILERGYKKPIVW